MLHQNTDRKGQKKHSKCKVFVYFKEKTFNYCFYLSTVKPFALKSKKCQFNLCYKIFLIRTY